MLKQLIPALCLCVIAPVSARGQDLFQQADAVPPDVTAFVHIEDAASLRQSIADRPIAAWFGSLIADGSLARAWAELSSALHVDQGVLFDQLFGKSLTVVLRGEEWAVLTDVDPQTMKRLTRQTVMKRQLPIGTAAVMEWPEQRLLIGLQGRSLLLGPSAEPALFRDLAESQTLKGIDTLAETQAIARGRELGGGDIGVFMRHDAPLGGWSVIVLALVDDAVTVDQVSEFEQWPFARAMTRKEAVDVAPLAAVEDSCLAAMLEPTDIGDSQIESFVAASLNLPLIGGRLRESLGDARLIILGQVDGRTGEAEVDVLIPTLAIALQMDDEEDAGLHADAHLSHLSDRIGRLRNSNGDALFSPIPIDDCEFRAVALNPARDSFGRLQPVVQTLSLNWQVIRAGEQPYCVIASHPTHLMDTVKALKASAEIPPQPESALANAGVLDGQRLSLVAESLGEQVQLLAEDESSDEFQMFFAHAAELARGIGHAEWQLKRPSQNTMVLKARVQLAPPDSGAAR